MVLGQSMHLNSCFAACRRSGANRLWQADTRGPVHGLDMMCDIMFKGAIARKRQCFEKIAQKSKPAFHWLKIRHRNAHAHCARSYSRADAYYFLPRTHTEVAKSSVNVHI